MERDVEKEKEWKEVRARNEERKNKKTDRQTDTEWIRKPWLVLINTKRLIAAALVSSANTCPLWGRILERNLFPIIYCCWPMHQKKREKTQAVLNTVSIFQCLLQLSCPSSPSPIWTIVLENCICGVLIITVIIIIIKLTIAIDALPLWCLTTDNNNTICEPLWWLCLK